MKIHCIDDFRRMAKQKLPPMIFDFIEGGASAEISLRANEQQLQDIFLRQRVLVDIDKIDTKASVLGQELDVPLMVAPIGSQAALHPKGDVAVAKAAADSNSIFVHSAWSTSPLEEVLKVAPNNVWCQIAFWGGDGFEPHFNKVKSSGVKVLVVSTDVASSHKRLRDLKHGIYGQMRPPLSDLLQTLLYPRWLWGRLTGPKIEYAHINAGRDWANLINKKADWRALYDLRQRWGGKLVVKGLMCPEDAVRAVEAGADGLIISNHGGRQFDSQPATVQVLPEIVQAVSDRAEIYIDGGIRTGTDVVRVLALGAKAVFVGRPFAYALASKGEAGILQAFEIYKEELRATMGSIGRKDLNSIDRSVLY